MSRVKPADLWFCALNHKRGCKCWDKLKPGLTEEAGVLLSTLLPTCYLSLIPPLWTMFGFLFYATALACVTSGFLIVLIMLQATSDSHLFNRNIPSYNPAFVSCGAPSLSQHFLSGFYINASDQRQNFQ